MKEVKWFSSYRVHHRGAALSKRRGYLLLEMQHIHSPAAGSQGMNTGIGDAVNLSRKLTEAIHNQAKEQLLLTYEQERIGSAKSLVKTTDRLFQQMVRKDFAGKLVRAFFVPYMLPFIFDFHAVRKVLFKRVSQMRIHYPHSELSEGTAGAVQAGD